ncbi:hypothetical protein HDU89_007612 [Geranomyces variabilis]|nr:hypothetical protein HDU89_007612 [Geranomyces variabilis]
MNPSPLFQIISDVHTEFYPSEEKVPHVTNNNGAHYLILAGDIGTLSTPGPAKNYAAYLSHAAKLFDKILLVMGNHEAYGTSVTRARELLHLLCAQVNRNIGKADRVIFLDRTAYDLYVPHLSKTITLLGCTLWSRITDEQMADVAFGLNDFRRTVDWNPEAYLQAHEEDVAWLTGAIDDEARVKTPVGREVVVITHHAPLTCGVSHPQFDKSPVSSAFQTDLSRLMQSPPVKLWVFGHTHYCSDQNVNGVRVVSSQMGYPGEAGKTGYVTPMVIE